MFPAFAKAQGLFLATHRRDLIAIESGCEETPLVAPDFLQSPPRTVRRAQLALKLRRHHRQAWWKSATENQKYLHLKLRQFDRRTVVIRTYPDKALDNEKKQILRKKHPFAENYLRDRWSGGRNMVGGSVGGTTG